MPNEPWKPKAAAAVADAATLSGGFNGTGFSSGLG